MDELVEAMLGFTGTKSSIAYHRSPSFGMIEGWRANVSDYLSPQRMLELQQTMADKFGVKANVLLHQPSPVPWKLEAGTPDLKNAFEIWDIELGFDDTLGRSFAPSWRIRWGHRIIGRAGCCQRATIA